MQKPVFTRKFSRELPLMLITIWYKGEDDPRQWTQKILLKRPHIVFVRDSEKTDAYYDKKGHSVLEKELATMRKQDPKFLTLVTNTFKAKYDKLKPLIEKDSAISLKELETVVNGACDTWPWFDAFWWSMDIAEKEKGSKDAILVQETRKYTENFVDDVYKTMCKALEKAFPEKTKYIDFILPEEAFSGRLPTEEELEKRSKHYIFTNNKLYVNESIGDIEKEFGIKILQEKPVENVDSFSGKTAFPGKVTGKVRKIFGKTTMHTIQEGEILVTTMTLPYFLPAIKKAAALVTDEGGITCHAAITARELKKPCIIATKIATKVLKDGDLIEVDADKGIVRKINSV